MIIFKVFKASRLCTAMSIAVFCVVLGVSALQRGAAGREPEAAPAMAMAQWEDAEETQPPAQEETRPSWTPSTENLFYLPAPAATPKTVETEADDVPGAQDGVRFEIIRSGAVTPQPLSAERPRVLIYHTHTWEAYEPDGDDVYTPTERWRTKDERFNVVRVGEELARLLEEEGFAVVHDKTAFEPPVLSSAYTRSLQMLEERALAGETFDYYIDLHRDAYSAGAYKSNTVAGPKGEELARLMMLIGKGTGVSGGVGYDVKPDWEQNILLADVLTQALNEQVEGLCGAVKVKTGRFNQHVSTRAILIEVGNNMNTLAQALRSMPYLARALARAQEASGNAL